MKKVNFGVASSIWCKMSEIKIDAPQGDTSTDKPDVADENGKKYADAVSKKFAHSSNKKPLEIDAVACSVYQQNAVFCPVYQQQASHTFNVYAKNGQFSSEFIHYLSKYDSLLFYGAEGMGCTTIFNKVCDYVLCNEISTDKKYLPVYIHANWLFREIRKSNNNYQIDKYIDDVLNDWIDDSTKYEVSELCKKNPILIIIDDINDETNDSIFKWICENINRKDIKIFISTNNSRIRTKFEKTFAAFLNGKVQYASIYLPLLNENQQGQNYKEIEPSLYELLEMTPYFKKLLDHCKGSYGGESLENISSVTALINKYVGDDGISEEGERCAKEIYEGRQKDLVPNEDILCHKLIHKEGKIYEFENKILYYYFLAKQLFKTFIDEKGQHSVKQSMFSIKAKAAETSGAELLHKYFISFALDGISQTLCLTDQEKCDVIDFYKDELPLILAESLRWTCNGNELHWEAGIEGLLSIIKRPEKYSEVETIDAERLLYLLGIGIQEQKDRLFLHYEVINSSPNKTKFLLPKDAMWFEMSYEDKTIEVARFPVTVAEFAFFLDSGYFCARDKCQAKETFDKSDAQAVWDEIWGKYDIVLVAKLMQEKWEEIHKRLNSETIIKLCKHFSDDKQIKQLYLFKELYNKNTITGGKSIEAGLSEIYSPEKLKYPMKWGDPLYSNPYYPIIGINYFEACAYCRWLSLLAGKNGKYEYRLLTKKEWQEMVKGVIPKKEDIICNIDDQDDYLRIAFLGSLRELNDELELTKGANSIDAYGNIFEIVDTQFSKIQYEDPNITHIYCFGGSYLQNYELAYDVCTRGPYEGQASSVQRNIDIGFRICRVKRKR